MKFKGTSVTSKGLGLMINPSEVHARAKGTALLCFAFKEPTKIYRNARWKFLYHMSKFSLDVEKEIEGLSPTAPDSVITMLMNSILPSVIGRAMENGLPADLGVFLRPKHNFLDFDGTLDVCGSTPSKHIWDANFADEEKEESAKAREIAGLTLASVKILKKVLFSAR